MPDSEDELPPLSPLISGVKKLQNEVQSFPSIEPPVSSGRNLAEVTSKRRKRRVVDDESFPESLDREIDPKDVEEEKNGAKDPVPDPSHSLSVSSAIGKRRRVSSQQLTDFADNPPDDERHGRYNLRKRTVEQKYIFTLDRLRNQAFQNEALRYADDEDSDEYLPEPESLPEGSSPSAMLPGAEESESDSEAKSDDSTILSGTNGETGDESLGETDDISHNFSRSKRINKTLPASRSAPARKSQSAAIELKVTAEYRDNQQIPRLAGRSKTAIAKPSSRKNVGSRQRRRMTPPKLSVVDVASHYGKDASNALRVAARTARSRGSKQGENPDRKFFFGNSTAQKTIKRWKYGELSLKDLQPKQYKSNTAMRTNVATKSLSHSRKEPRRKRSKSPSTQYYHTPIIEIADLSPKRISHSRREHTKKPDSSEKPRKTTSSSRPRKAQVNEVDLEEIGPFRHLNFTQDTFYGSNTSDLLEAPQVWTAETGPLGFGCDSSAPESDIERTIKDILHVLKGDAGEIDSQLYNSIYAWLLRLVGQFVDDSQIVESSARRRIAHSLSKLAREVTSLPTSGLRTPLKVLVIFAATMFTKGASKRDLSALHDFFAAQRAATKVICESVDELVLEIKSSSHKSVVGRLFPGIELVLASERLGILTDIDKIHCSWPLILILAEARRPISNWQVVRKYTRPPLLSFETSRVALQGCIKLMQLCDWPPCADVVIDFFLWYAKQNHYADPRGEYIGLPDFLWTNRMVDWDAPEYHLYLYFLAITLSKMRAIDDKTGARRVYNRVNPLGTLNFPETEPVTVTRLSQASQQYGTLLVILRHGVPSCRPSVLQIRELVQLRGAHVAIRLKAVSAWAATSYIAGNEDFEECRNWLKDLATYCHWEDHEVWVELARRSESLVRAGYHVLSPELFCGLSSQPPHIQRRMWSLISVLVDRREITDLRECVAGPLLDYFSKVEPSELEVHQWIPVASLLDLVEWPNNKTRPLFFAGLVPMGRHIIDIVVEALRSSVIPSWLYEPRLFAAISRYWGGIQAQWTARNRKPLFVVFVNFLVRARHTKPLSDILNLVRDHYRSPNTSMEYESTVIRPLRRLAFEHLPSLSSSHRWFDDSRAMDIEIAHFQLRAPQRHLLWFISQKLRRSLVFDKGYSFVGDISDAWLSISTPVIALEAFDVLVNSLAIFLKLAPWHMSVVSGILPLIIRVTRNCIEGTPLPVNAETILVEGFRVLNWCVRARMPASTLLHCELYSLAISCLRNEWVQRHKSNIHVGLWSYDWRLRRFREGFIYLPPQDHEDTNPDLSTEAIQAVLEAVSGVDFASEDPSSEVFDGMRHRLREVCVNLEFESDLPHETLHVLENDSAGLPLIAAVDPLAWTDETYSTGVGWRPLPNI